MSVLRLPPLLLLALSVALVTPTGAGTAPSVDSSRAEVRELGEQLAALDARAGEAAAAHNTALERLSQLEDRIILTERQVGQARRSLDIARRALADRLVAAYVARPPSLAELLVGARSLSELVAARELTEVIAETDASVVGNARERRLRLERIEERLRSARVAADREVRVRAARQREVAALVAARRQLLADARAELREAIAEEKRRQRQLALARQARAATGAPYAANSVETIVPSALPGGGYVFPVAGPNRFSDDWLYSRPGGRVHQGIDIFAERGTPLVAVADGSLYNVGFNGLGGWRLWLRDGAGNAFYYAHLDAFAPAAREGAQVPKGTVVGYVGDSGDARGTSPHVHFEIHPGGAGPVRPYPIVAGWPRVR